jgi:hypothetical protein
MQLKITPILMILSLLAVGVFGFLGLGYIDHASDHDCPISVILGGDCPPIGNALTLATHHLSGLQHVTQSILTIDPILLTLLILLLVALFLIFTNLLKDISTKQNFAYKKHYENEDIKFKANNSLLCWLALHNKRDPHALKWVHGIT